MKPKQVNPGGGRPNRGDSKTKQQANNTTNKTIAEKQTAICRVILSGVCGHA